MNGQLHQTFLASINLGEPAWLLCLPLLWLLAYWLLKQRGKPREITVPNLYLFMNQTAPAVNAQRHLWRLLFTGLLLLLPVLMLTQPVYQSGRAKPTLTGERHWLLILDQSASMQYRNKSEGPTLFERAKSQMMRFKQAELSSATQATILGLSDAAKILPDRELEPGWSGVSHVHLNAIIQKFKKTVTTKALEVIVWTDQSGRATLSASQAEFKDDQAVDLKLIEVGGFSRNLYVRANQILRTDTGTYLSGHLKDSAPQQKSSKPITVKLELTLDGTANPQTSQQTIPHTTATSRFQFKLPEIDWNKSAHGSITLSAPDRHNQFKADDTFHFTYQKPAPLQITLLAEQEVPYSQFLKTFEVDTAKAFLQPAQVKLAAHLPDQGYASDLTVITDAKWLSRRTTQKHIQDGHPTLLWLNNQPAWIEGIESLFEEASVPFKHEQNEQNNGPNKEVFASITLSNLALTPSLVPETFRNDFFFQVNQLKCPAWQFHLDHLPASISWQSIRGGSDQKSFLFAIPKMQQVRLGILNLDAASTEPSAHLYTLIQALYRQLIQTKTPNFLHHHPATARKQTRIAWQLSTIATATELSERNLTTLEGTSPQVSYDNKLGTLGWWPKANTSPTTIGLFQGDTQIATTSLNIPITESERAQTHTTQTSKQVPSTDDLLVSSNTVNESPLWPWLLACLIVLLCADWLLQRSQYA